MPRIWATILVILLCFMVTPARAADPAHGASCSGFTSGTNACNVNGCFVCTGGNWVDQPLYIGTSAATCGSTYEGMQRYNSTNKVMETCNATVWSGTGQLQSSTNLSTCNAANNGMMRYHTGISASTPVVAHYALSTGSSSSVTVTNTPSSAGDLLLLIVSTDNAPVTFSWPSGFTDIGAGPINDAGSTDGQTMAIAYKIATSTEPTTYTLGVSGGSQSSAETLLHITGASVSSPIDTYGYTTNTAGTTVPPALAVSSPSITPTTNNDLILWAVTGDSNQTGSYTYTDPSGMTQVGTTNNNGVWSSVEVAQSSQTTATATGVLSGTVYIATSGTMGTIAFSVAIRSKTNTDAVEVCNGSSWKTLATPY